MGKRGRMASEDLDYLNGISDGTYTYKDYTRTIKGHSRVDVVDNSYEKITIRYVRDPHLPATVNGGWKMTSMESMNKHDLSRETAKVEETKFTQPLDNDSLPKTKRKYYNPINKKWVGYTRAVALRLVK
jgi:hypothetical protein